MYPPDSFLLGFRYLHSMKKKPNKDEATAQGVLADAALKAQALLEAARELQKREVPYSNRELDSMFKNIENLVVEGNNKNDAQNIEILKQTTKTNGSVASLSKWQQRSIGAGSLALIVIVPILGWSLLEIIGNISSIGILNSKVYTLSHTQ